MSSVDRQPETKAYWRSLAELENAPEFRVFMESEFPAGADPKGINRRRWLQLMGASISLAGVAGCRWPQEEILPFAERPEGRVPGETQQYTTAMDLAGRAIGLLVTTVDGRPIKVEGNPAHPLSLGATGLFAQASILELYDPDRSQFVIQGTDNNALTQTWEQFDKFAKGHFDTVRSADGEGLCVLAEANSSPALAGLRGKLLESHAQAKWFEYEPISQDNERAGTQVAFGRPLQPHLALDQASVIVCLDADILGTHPAALRHARQFSAGRDPASGSMNRMYAVESGVSLTGSTADHRLPLRSSQIAGFVTRLRDEIEHASASGDSGHDHAHHDHGDDDAVGQFIHAMAVDLVAHHGKCLIVVGSQQPPEVHAEVHRLNADLGNLGQTVTFAEAADPQRPSHVEAIRALTQAMTAGSVKTLLILGGNPVYDAPADLGFAEALKQVETSIHLGIYRNETGRECQWHLPQAHYLESWGDTRALDGTYSIVQPMIQPLHRGRSALELLAALLGETTKSGEALVRESFQAVAGDSASDAAWRKTLHDGVLEGSQSPLQDVSPVEADRLTAALADELPGTDDLEIVFYQDVTLYDGRFANSGWLQECPRPLTKVTWDNVAIMAPATAKLLGVEFESLVTLKYRDREELKLPVYVLPGQAPGSIAVVLGYGRTAAGRVGGDAAAGIPSVGADTYQLRVSDAMHFDSGLTVRRASGKHRLATTQDHHAIDEIGMKGRDERVGQLLRGATLEHYREHPDFAQHAVHHPPLESLWDEHEYTGHRWGMSIDLSKCIGCNACVVACQAENNIPIVGKEQVLVGREMHWIRVDRYFQGDVDDPSVVHQPVTCHHCELAPCEQVCPVNATVHSHEGLNDMVYNRCIGTRYCGNNCPYKVRRFNYFNYHKDLKDANNAISKLMYNPEVTVRARGVMEKCTYCVQRIQNVKIGAKNEQRPIEDGEIKTACQQVCPSQAITFGDLADQKSEVAQQQRLDRSYAMLGELNIKPRTQYLARITNPNPQLDDSHSEHVDGNH